MKGIERYALVDKIGRHLQSTMTTTDINVYLGGFGIEHNMSNSVSSKWVYVKGLLSAVDDGLVIRIAADLGLPLPTGTSAGSEKLKTILNAQGLVVCQQDFARALEDVEADPAQAIGHASTTLESICKAILDAFAEPYPQDESLQPLLKAVTGVLRLSPDGQADPEIKRVLGGLTNAGAGLAVLRTKYSTFHGKGASQKRLGARHARLSVNALAAVGLFLLETHLENAKESPL